MPIITLRPKKNSDADYVRGIAEGNDNLGGKLYQEWVDYFENKCHKLFFNITKEDKEDAMQEAYYVLFQKIKHGAIHVEGDKVIGRDGNLFKSSLMTYLMAVAVNLKRELVRKNDKLKYWDDIFASAEIQTAMFSSAGYVYSPEEQAMHEIIAQCLTIMAENAKICHKILTMFYYEEKSYDEILLFYSEEKDGPKNYRSLITKSYKCRNTLRELFNKKYSKYLNS